MNVGEVAKKLTEEVVHEHVEGGCLRIYSLPGVLLWDLLAMKAPCRVMIELEDIQLELVYIPEMKDFFVKLENLNEYVPISALTRTLLRFS